MKSIAKISVILLVSIFISKNTMSNITINHVHYMIVDSIEIRKQQVNDFYSVVSSNAYIPVSFIDKNFIDNLKAFSNVMNTCRQIEKEMEEEKNKSFIIFDAPVREKNSNNKNVPIG